MRTNIVIDDRLMKRAMRACGAKTKREAVERSLELMVRLAEQEKLIRSARGKLRWEGDLAEMRRDVIVSGEHQDGVGRRRGQHREKALQRLITLAG